MGRVQKLLKRARTCENLLKMQDKSEEKGTFVLNMRKVASDFQALN